MTRLRTSTCALPSQSQQLQPVHTTRLNSNSVRTTLCLAATYVAPAQLFFHADGGRLSKLLTKWCTCELLTPEAASGCLLAMQAPRLEDYTFAKGIAVCHEDILKTSWADALPL